MIKSRAMAGTRLFARLSALLDRHHAAEAPGSPLTALTPRELVERSLLGRAALSQLPRFTACFRSRARGRASTSDDVGGEAQKTSRAAGKDAERDSAGSRRARQKALRGATAAQLEARLHVVRA